MLAQKVVGELTKFKVQPDGFGVNYGDFLDAMSAHALSQTTAVATILGDFREAYGLKVVTPILFRSAAAAIFVLLREFQHHPQDPEVPPMNDSKQPIDPIAWTHAAFEECFRCLWAGAIHLLLPRAAIRSIIKAAREMGVTLPDGVAGILDLDAGLSWCPDHLRKLSLWYSHGDLPLGRRSLASTGLLADLLSVEDR